MWRKSGKYFRIIKIKIQWKGINRTLSFPDIQE